MFSIDRSTQLRLLAPVFVLIAGCGGGSGGGGSSGGGGGNPTTVSFSFAGGAPAVVAAKIGTGAFTSESLSGGKFSLSVPSGTSNFAVAYVCTVASLPTFQEVFEASVADGSSFTLPCLLPVSPATNGTLTGNVDASAIPNANQLSIAADNGSIESGGTISADTNFNLSVPAGNDRVEVLAYNDVAQGFTSTATLLAAKNFTGQAIPGALNGGSQVVLGAGDATTSQTIAYEDIPSGYSAPSTRVVFNMGGHGGFSIATASSQYPVLPAGAVASGDFYEFFATTQNGATPGEIMIVTQTSANPGAVSLQFPSPWSYAGPTPAALPSFNFTYAGFSGKDGVFDSAVVGWPTSNGFDEYTVVASSNYLGGSTAVAFPDLSSVPGFVVQPPSGTAVIWLGLITQNSLGVSQPLTSNASIMAVGNSGTYSVP